MYCSVYIVYWLACVVYIGRMILGRFLEYILEYTLAMSWYRCWYRRRQCAISHLRSFANMASADVLCWSWGQRFVFHAKFSETAVY